MTSSQQSDLYAVLGVSKGSSDEEIKRAYLRLCRENQPSRSCSEEENKAREDRLSRVQSAYNVLTDKKKRKEYDNGGVDFSDVMSQFFGGGGGGGSQMPAGFGSPFGSMPFVQFGSSGDGFGGFPGMGGASNGCGQRQSASRAAPKPKAPLIKETLEISVFEAYNGVKRSKRYQRRSESGSVTFASVDVNVLAGMKSGSRFTFEGKGHTEQGKSIGDVIVTLKIAPHPIYSIDEIDVINTVHISLKESLENRPRKYRVASLKGTETDIIISEDENITNETTRDIPGQGMPDRKNKGKFGKMIVKFVVDIPTKLSKETRESILRLL